MTKHRSFKLLVRARMNKTGESYTTARQHLLYDTPPEPGSDSDFPRLATSDERIRERTGKGWEEWFEFLDQQGAADRTHRANAKWLAEHLGTTPLAWAPQAITTSYERARLGREIGRMASGGFAITASKRIAAIPAVVFEAIPDLVGSSLVPLGNNPPKSARYTGGRDTRVTVFVDPLGTDRSVVSVQVARLLDGSAADEARTYWRKSLAEWKLRVEGATND